MASRGRPRKAITAAKDALQAAEKARGEAEDRLRQARERQADLEKAMEAARSTRRERMEADARGLETYTKKARREDDQAIRALRDEMDSAADSVVVLERVLEDLKADETKAAVELGRVELQEQDSAIQDLLRDWATAHNAAHERIVQLGEMYRARSIRARQTVKQLREILPAGPEREDAQRELLRCAGGERLSHAFARWTRPEAPTLARRLMATAVDVEALLEGRDFEVPVPGKPMRVQNHDQAAEESGGNKAAA